MKYNYIDGREDHGLQYDWGLIKREYNRLGCPQDVYNPTTAPLSEVGYIFNLSTRSVGKTTNWLLLGMVMHKLYGTQIQYIRQIEDQTAPKNAKQLFSTICEYKQGYYIKKLTGGRWNSIKVDARRAYYSLVEDGHTIEKAEQPFLQMLTIDKWADIKSTYNAPLGDLILVDEFIGKYYLPDEFLHLLDVVKTIIRERKSSLIVMLANTINAYHQYFKEFEISKVVRTLKSGENARIRTSLGTEIYMEIVAIKNRKYRNEVNSKYFGFDNPGLNAIRGTGDVWALIKVPHIRADWECESMAKNLKLRIGDDYLTLELARQSELGLVGLVYPCTKVYSDSIILTDGEIWDPREHYGLGENLKISKIFWNLLKCNKVYYDSNETGSMLTGYVKNMKLKKIL